MISSFPPLPLTLFFDCVFFSFFLFFFLFVGAQGFDGDVLLLRQCRDGVGRKGTEGCVGAFVHECGVYIMYGLI